MVNYLNVSRLLNVQKIWHYNRQKKYFLISEGEKNEKVGENEAIDISKLESEKKVASLNKQVSYSSSVYGLLLLVYNTYRLQTWKKINSCK